MSKGKQHKTGLRNIVLVWAVGLLLGIAAGALTAMWLLPHSVGAVSDTLELPSSR